MFHPRGPTLLELARQGLSSTRRGYDLLAPKFDYTPFRTPDGVLRVVGQRLARRAPFADGLDLCCGTGAGLRMLRRLCARRVVGLDFSAGMLAEARRQLNQQLDLQPNLQQDHQLNQQLDLQPNLQPNLQQGHQQEVQPGSQPGWQPGSQPGERTEVAPVQLVQGDACALGFEAAFDVVTCFGALGHIPRREQRRFAGGIFRALRPGGLFACVTIPMPPPGSAPWLLGRGYNAVAHLRNRLVRPPFVMCYLTFTLGEARRLLAEAGFEVDVERDLFPPPYQRAVLVLARRAGA